MNRIGIYICNYNGKDWAINCIHSLLKQTVTAFDIHLIDNASTDGSVEEIKKEFNDKVFCICNSENLGGSGGFDTGLQHALKERYEYIVLLDNDIILDKYCIENMMDYLEQYSDVGIVGAKVMVMDNPNMIQDFGNYLNFNLYKEELGYSWRYDGDDVPKIHECDYVPSCAIMIRSSMLRKSGTMPRDNFIYYDDIELSYKMKLHGWKIVALANVKVWHKAGFMKGKKNTFARYYFFRNRLHFFAKYIEEQEIDDFINVILRELFSQMYGYYNKGMSELLKTTMYAFDDFLHGVRGKVQSDKVMDILERKTPFEKIIENKNRIQIKLIDNFNENDEMDIYQILFSIIETIQRTNCQEKIWIALKNTRYTEAEFLEKWNLIKIIKQKQEEYPQIIFSSENEKFDLNLQLCEHVRMVKESILPSVYVDRYCNCISSEEEFKYHTGYFINEEIFVQMYYSLMNQAIIRIREEI